MFGFYWLALLFGKYGYQGVRSLLPGREPHRLRV